MATAVIVKATVKKDEIEEFAEVFKKALIYFSKSVNMTVIKIEKKENG